MTKMSLTVRAQNLDAYHAVTDVSPFLDGSGQNIEKGWPATPALILGVGREKRVAASRAAILPRPFFMVERT
jgi:hypothetical protein